MKTRKENYSVCPYGARWLRLDCWNRTYYVERMFLISSGIFYTLAKLYAEPPLIPSQGVGIPPGGHV